MVKSKKIIIMSYTIITILIINFMIIGTSQSKYIEKKNCALAFDTNLASLNNTGTFNITTSSETDYDEVVVGFNFPRNNFVLEDNVKDKYTIKLRANNEINSGKLNENCTVKILNGSEWVTEKEVEFNTASTNESISVRVSCHKNDVTENINGIDTIYLDAFVEETVEDYTFRYIKSNKPYSIELAEYNNDHPKQHEGDYFELTVSNNINLHDALIEWLSKYYYPYISDSIIKSAINLYVKDYIDENVIKNGFKGLEINGPIDNKYTIKIEDNFIGYAKTYQYMNENKFGRYTLFFSSTNNIELDSIFEYYLNEYYSLDLENIKLIMEYINYLTDNSGISYYILENNASNNIFHEEVGKITIFVDDLLLEAEEWQTSKSVGDEPLEEEPGIEEEIPKVDEKDNNKEENNPNVEDVTNPDDNENKGREEDKKEETKTLKEYLKENFNLMEDTLNEVEKIEGIEDSYQKYLDKELVKDYYIIIENDNNYLLEIYNEEEINKITMVKLDVTVPLTLENKENDKLNITFKVTDKLEIDNIVKKLEYIFSITNINLSEIKVDEELQTYEYLVEIDKKMINLKSTETLN